MISIYDSWKIKNVRIDSFNSCFGKYKNTYVASLHLHRIEKLYNIKSVVFDYVQKELKRD